jgi:hypothetical protein
VIHGQTVAHDSKTLIKLHTMVRMGTVYDLMHIADQNSKKKIQCIYKRM